MKRGGVKRGISWRINEGIRMGMIEGQCPSWERLLGRLVGFMDPESLMNFPLMNGVTLILSDLGDFTI